MSLKIVIAGGVAAGTSAAAKARRCDEHAEIVLFEQGSSISYATCGMPYYLNGVIKERESLLVVKPDSFARRFNIRLCLRHRVEAIHSEEQEVRVRDLSTNRTFRERYDRLILCTGSRAVVPPLPGVELPFVFSLKSLDDMDQIFSFMAEKSPRRSAVIGGGLIGVEMAECLRERGLEVTLVEMMEQVLPFLDWDMAQLIQAHLDEKGVRLLLGQPLKSIGSGAGGDGEVIIGSGFRVPCDMVILAIGVRPDVELARRAGVDIGPTGAVSVDDETRTSLPHIFAAGDCAEAMHLITGKTAYMPMATVANKQGRAAGANAVGRHLKVQGFCGTVIVKSFEMTAARTGLNQREALREGMDPLVHYIHPGDHAGYYPGSHPLHIKIITCRRTGHLLGAQVVGRKGVDKRIDVFAAALYNRMKTEDLIHLDLAYAPPYAPARDAVLVAGATGQTLFSGDWRPILPAELYERIHGNDQLCIVDVRQPKECREEGIIPGAIEIPLPDLRERIGELDPDRETVVYCRQGVRAYIATRIMSQRGFRDVKNLTGGVLSWPYELVKQNRSEPDGDPLKGCES